MYKRLLLIVPICLLMAVTACNKKEDRNRKIGNRQDMIRDTKWRISQFKDNGNVVALGCRADDTWTFIRGGNGSIEDGDQRCGTSDPVISFTYSITGDQRNLYIANMSQPAYGSYFTDGNRIDFDIRYMDESTMNVEYYDKGTGNNDAHYIEVSFISVLR